MLKYVPSMKVIHFTYLCDKYADYVTDRILVIRNIIEKGIDQL